MEQVRELMERYGITKEEAAVLLVNLLEIEERLVSQSATFPKRYELTNYMY